jgi:lipoyl(octanoyl) transferase
MTGRAGLAVEWLGRVAYGPALTRQEDAVARRAAGEGTDRLLLLEHPPVVTLGRGARETSLLVAREALVDRGVEVHEIARGGDVTLHVPGQLVGYLVMDLRARGRPDLHAFLRSMEGALISALHEIGIAARRVEGRTGVFVERRDDEPPPAPDRKIASIGIGVRRWITYHGFALNVTNDLDSFDWIVPCGLHDVEMTSVARELGSGPLGLDARVRASVERAFREAFA